jgi:hypothetical protein
MITLHKFNRALRGGTGLGHNRPDSPPFCDCFGVVMSRLRRGQHGANFWAGGVGCWDGWLREDFGGYLTTRRLDAA